MGLSAVTIITDHQSAILAHSAQGALEKDGSISLTPRFSGVSSRSRSFLTVSTVLPVFAGTFGTFLGAPCHSARFRFLARDSSARRCLKSTNFLCNVGSLK